MAVLNKRIRKKPLIIFIAVAFLIILIYLWFSIYQPVFKCWGVVSDNENVAKVHQVIIDDETETLDIGFTLKENKSMEDLDIGSLSEEIFKVAPKGISSIKFIVESNGEEIVEKVYK